MAGSGLCAPSRLQSHPNAGRPGPAPTLPSSAGRHPPPPDQRSSGGRYLTHWPRGSAGEEMRDPEFTQIVEFCEACLDRHGDSYLGVGWTKRQADADTRYRVMLDIVREPVETPLTLLD